MSKPTDTNQANEDELRTLDDILSQAFTDGASDTMWQDERHVEIFATAKKELQALIRTEKLELLNELEKSMSTVEQLNTKYGYHPPERMYGYKLAVHDTREVIAKLEAEL
jgi:hypothetical protein